MNTLPQEITALIASHLEPPLAPYASISRQWQRAIEHETFSSITTSSDSFDDEFAPAFSDDRNKLHRRGLLRSLTYEIVLPSSPKKKMRSMQRTAEKEENSKVFTREVARLFRFLGSWKEYDEAKEEEEEGPGVSLTITPLARTDQYGASGVKRMRDQLKEVGFDAEVLRAEQENGGGSGELVPAVVVRHLDIGYGSGRRLNPAAVGVLAAAAPKLTGFDMWFYPVGKRLMDERRRWRSRLADSLLSVATSGLMTHLTTLRLWIADAEPWNQKCEPGRLVKGRDRLSSAIRKMSQLPALKELALQGQHIISSELFEDPTEQDSGSWPSLTHIELSMSLISPDGHWAIAGNPDSEDAPSEEEESDEDESRLDSGDSNMSDHVPEARWRKENGEIPQNFFRGKPVDGVLEPVMAAMARATRRMPKLQGIKFYLQGGAPLATMSVEYYGRGQLAWVGEDYPNREEHLEFVNSPSASPRWVFYLQQGFSRWSIPAQLRADLIESVGEGNVRLIRTWSDEDGGEDSVQKERF